jgi:hypothetical protein
MHLSKELVDTLIAIRNERVANRVALHLALGGGFQIPPTP